MANIDELLKLDNRCLNYIDSNDVHVEKITFSEIGKSYHERRSFYRIDGIDNYIIKDSKLLPFFFNNIRNKNLLRCLINKQRELPNIDFPIGYFRDNDKMIGTIIPYYQKAVSLKTLIYLENFDTFSNYYNHDDDVVENLVIFFLDVLEIIRSMYEKGMIYTDVHSGNFLLYKNDVKIIDFDPGFVFFGSRKTEHYEKMLFNYTSLVEIMCHRYGFKDVIVRNMDSFDEIEDRVKVLRKELER